MVMDFKFSFGTLMLFISQITSSPIISYSNNNYNGGKFIEDTEIDNSIGRYQVTENIIDVPDNRTLAPIVPNFSINPGLNYGNTTVKQNETYIDKEENWNKEEGNPNNEAVNIENKPNKEDLNNDKGNNVKKNQFSILHIKGEYEDNEKVENTNDKCKYVFRCLKDYLYGVKKGFVDGIHSFLSGRKEKPHSILDKFHRNADSDDSDDDYDDLDDTGDIHSFIDEFDDEK